MADSKAPAGSVTEKLIATVRSRFPGTTLISGYRKNAITVTGNKSMHSKACAVDLPPKREIFDWIRATYGPITFELIYSPAGKDQIYKGQPHVFTGAVRATHYDHVHWSMTPENAASLGGAAPTTDTLSPATEAPAESSNAFTGITAFFGEGNGGRRLAFIGVGVGLVILSVPILFHKRVGEVVNGLAG